MSDSKSSSSWKSAVFRHETILLLVLIAEVLLTPRQKVGHKADA